ncbi:MAG: hypothetical protein CO113_14040 [Elusimicrobia bacterium CG_4_9_14_3_um_filter_62_55]|nr:MAG: hypothetical protein COR54_19385 [Elusimicrobia bacterium CG22_combo_CG10-13_8_21_14_all_63_91]PJB24364.1 MAG: hypothetical protein CO113_14040 [Elusimicrobia bacterium CG_4_9_14_3_um_filter_62_55]
MNKLRLLDCTFRAGGYYNNWDYEQGLVQEYLERVGQAKIDAVEMGFRFFPQRVYFNIQALCRPGSGRYP